MTRCPHCTYTGCEVVYRARWVLVYECGRCSRRWSKALKALR